MEMIAKGYLTSEEKNSLDPQYDVVFTELAVIWRTDSGTKVSESREPVPLLGING